MTTLKELRQALAVASEVAKNAAEAAEQATQAYVMASRSMNDAESVMNQAKLMKQHLEYLIGRAEEPEQMLLDHYSQDQVERCLVKQGMTRLQAKERTEKAAATVWDRTKQP